MRRTNNNCIMVLDAMKENSMVIANMYKDNGDVVRYRNEMREVSALTKAIALLKDKEYFDDMVKLYNVE